MLKYLKKLSHSVHAITTKDCHNLFNTVFGISDKTDVSKRYDLELETSTCKGLETTTAE